MEAAFLEGNLETPMYLDIPHALVDLGLCVLLLSVLCRRVFRVVKNESLRGFEDLKYEM